MRSRLPRFLVLGAILSAAFITQSAATLAQTGAKPAPDPLVTVNTEFRERYARARTDALARTSPVIVVYEGDKVVLLRNGTRTEATFVPASDMALKSVAHVPLGVYASLHKFAGTTLDEPTIGSLRLYRESINTASSSLGSRGFPQAVMERQYRILEQSMSILDNAISSGTVTPEQLRAFSRTLGPLVLENIGDAARAQVDGLHSRVTEWRRLLTPAEWASLHVVVIGVHMARDGELATQYFLRLLGEQEEGRRVVYAEGLWDEARALELLGTHVLDGSAGEAFFGSYLRMHRDVLADAARSYMDVLHVEP